MKNHYKLWTILSLIVVFAAGAISGILIEKHILIEKQDSRTERSNFQKKPPTRYPTLDLMAEELELTTEQREQLRGIFKNNEERFKTLRKEQFDCLKTIRSQLNQEIKNVLTEEQQVKYEAMIEKYHSQRNKERETLKKQSDRKTRDKGEQK